LVEDETKIKSLSSQLSASEMLVNRKLPLRYLMLLRKGSMNVHFMLILETIFPQERNLIGDRDNAFKVTDNRGQHRRQRKWSLIPEEFRQVQPLWRFH